MRREWPFRKTLKRESIFSLGLGISFWDPFGCYNRWVFMVKLGKCRRHVMLKWVTEPKKDLSYCNILLSTQKNSTWIKIVIVQYKLFDILI